MCADYFTQTGGQSIGVPGKVALARPVLRTQGRIAAHVDDWELVRSWVKERRQTESGHVKRIRLYSIAFYPVVETEIETKNGGWSDDPGQAGGAVQAIIWLAQAGAARIICAVECRVPHLVFVFLRKPEETSHFIGKVVVQAAAVFIRGR